MSYATSVPAELAACFNDSPTVNTWAQNEAMRVRNAAAIAIAAQLDAAKRAKNDTGYGVAADAFFTAMRHR